MSRIIFAMLVTLCCVTASHAQSAAVEFMNNARIEATLLQMANQPQNAKVLGLTTEQSEKIREVTNEFDQKLAESAERIQFDKSLTEAEKAQKTREAIRKHTDEISGVLDEMLTPTQREQLTSMFINAAMQFGGLKRWFESTEMKELLQYTPEQQKKVVDRAAALDREYRAKIEELRTSMLKRLAREELDAEQRAKLQKVLKTDL